MSSVSGFPGSGVGVGDRQGSRENWWSIRGPRPKLEVRLGEQGVHFWLVVQ